MMPTRKCTAIVSQPEIVTEREFACALPAVEPIEVPGIASALMGTTGIYWAPGSEY
jgi:hypothetical protein